ncbi:hypothetical protein V8C26DRAFT_404246 [Trichoderma gracile]
MRSGNSCSLLPPSQRHLYLCLFCLAQTCDSHAATLQMLATATVCMYCFRNTTSSSYLSRSAIVTLAHERADKGLLIKAHPIQTVLQATDPCRSRRCFKSDLARSSVH